MRKLNTSATAISREVPSLPIKLALEKNIIKKNYTVFDYGCGRGDDIFNLIELGIKAKGWDPCYRNNILEVSDIVNLGYVLNVLPFEKERETALKVAWALTNKVLLITVRTGKPKTGWIRYNDGYVTKRNTFQKFYKRNEFKDYVNKTLDVNSEWLGCWVLVVKK